MCSNNDLIDEQFARRVQANSLARYIWVVFIMNVPTATTRCAVGRIDVVPPAAYRHRISQHQRTVAVSENENIVLFKKEASMIFFFFFLE